MPELVSPTAALRDSWLESLAEWGPEAIQDGAGLRPGDDVGTVTGFDTWITRLLRDADPATILEEGWVHATSWWIVEDGRYLGAISLRHRLNDFLFRAGGHIGYGVRPSSRRRGLAGWALGRVLPHARELGLRRVLLTCGDTNEASARIIESHGGVLEDTRDTELGVTRRYWIDL